MHQGHDARAGDASLLFKLAHGRAHWILMPAAVDAALLHSARSCFGELPRPGSHHCGQLCCSISQARRVSSGCWREPAWGICQVPCVSSTRLQEDNKCC